MSLSWDAKNNMMGIFENMVANVRNGASPEDEIEVASGDSQYNEDHIWTDTSVLQKLNASWDYKAMLKDNGDGTYTLTFENSLPNAVIGRYVSDVQEADPNARVTAYDNKSIVLSPYKVNAPADMTDGSGYQEATNVTEKDYQAAIKDADKWSGKNERKMDLAIERAMEFGKKLGKSKKEIDADLK